MKLISLFCIYIKFYQYNFMDDIILNQLVVPMWINLWVPCFVPELHLFAFMPILCWLLQCFSVFIYFLIFEATYFNLHYIQRLSAPLYEICTTTPTASKVMIWKPVLGNSYPCHAKTGSEFWHENKAQLRLSLISVSLTSLCKIMYCLLSLQQFATIPSIFPWYVSSSLLR